MYGGHFACHCYKMSSEPVPATWFHQERNPGSAARSACTTAPFTGAVVASAPAAPGRGRRCYSVSYHWGVVIKRSVSLADDVAKAVEAAAREDGVSFSSWLTTAAERQLRVRKGLRGVAAWEAEAGTLTAEEIAAGEALLARLLSGVSGMASRVRRR